MTARDPGAGPRPPMPTPTRVAVVLLAVLGVLLLLNAALTAGTREVVVDRLVEAGADRGTAARTLLLYGAAYALIGVAALVAAVFLPRRRGWARLLGVLITSLLTVGTLLSVVTAGGVTPIGLLLLVAAVAGVTSLVSRQTGDWLRGAPAEG